MNKSSLSPPLGVLSALALLATVSAASAQFDDFIDFGSTTGKLNDLDGSIANVTAFNGNPFTVAYSPDSIDFGGTALAGANSGVFLSLDPSSTSPLSGVQDDLQRLQLDVTIGPANEAQDLTVQFTDTLFGSGYAYQYDLSGLAAGQHTLFGPVLNAGAPVGQALDYNADLIDQVTFFSGNFVAGVNQNVDFSVDSLSLFTPIQVPPGEIEFGPVRNQLAFSNGGLNGFIGERGVHFDGDPLIPLPAPNDSPDGLQFTGTVQARSLNGYGVELTEGVDISPPENPLNQAADELVLEIVVGENNQVRDLIFEIIATSGPGGAEIAQRSWNLGGIQDLEPGTHIITGPVFNTGTSGTGVFDFDPTQGDLVNKIVLFGFNAENPDEPTTPDVTDKLLDITIKSVSFGQDSVGGLGGDFNGDDVVDIADYTVWRDNFNAPEGALGGNGDGSGTVDQGDYDLWVLNFGNTAGSTLAVPEPASAAGLLLVVAGFAQRRRID
ncbi:MAG: PEP-CTERM sorting domain-containing protein [Planctomycetota bacterium]